MPTVAEYLENITPAQRAEYRRIRKIVKQAVPKVEEVISYGIPTFRYHNQNLIYFGAFKNHMSLFPASDSMVEAIGELAKFRASKGTVQFTEDKPIPMPVIKKIVRYRLAAISKV